MARGGAVLDGGCGLGVAPGATEVPAEGVTVTPAFILLLKLLLPRYTTPLFSPPSTGSGTSIPPFYSAFSVVSCWASGYDTSRRLVKPMYR